MARGNKRRRELERARYQRRVQNWHTRRRRNVRILASGGIALVVAAGVAVAAVLAFSGSPAKNVAASSSASSSASASASAAATPDEDCVTKTADTSSPRPSSSVEPAVTIDTSATYTATLTTNCGTITFTMDAKAAPHTVNSFVHLADEHFFDDTPCHRLVEAQGLYVLQCGDPTGSGSGGPGYSIPDENLPTSQPTDANGAVTYKAGSVVMANTGQPNTGGSQFFIVFQDSTLPPTYAPFGTLTGDSLQVVRKIAAAGTDNSESAGAGVPNAKPVLETVTATKG